MHRALTSLLAMGLTLGTTASVVLASNTNSSLAGRKEVSINGVAISNPYGRVSSNTMHMPIWYVGQALQSIPDVKQSWNGNTHIWNITIPPNLLSSLSTIPIGTGNTTIIVNGTPIKKVDTFAATDPASNKPTVYMPIWYIIQILSSIGVVNTWDGNDWNIVYVPGGSSLGGGFGNTLGNTLGNTVGNTLGNSVGNTIGSNSTLNSTLDSLSSTLNSTVGSVESLVGNTLS
ncbi:hypothetical protein [Alicyclobacillus dauci]|uniref:Copper amine oxidase N-terminal domain-containing protein n=1 Tax=Alicyclobacillus dauci TaxID=1475485 RepID=A0ABY6Z583_9BACL|nr:hypothetical protein [Alicyclobacillus dauci]WAH38048.1 hypothetical protein NZD86_06045 [Alicyclobacillus dauci]